MKKLAAALVGLFVLVSSAAARPAPPPAFPWFHSALTRFLDSGRVLVLGWSKDGKVAVLYPEDGGGRGGPGLNFLLFDTIEDDILKAVDVWPDEFDQMGEYSDVLADAMWYSDKVQDFIEAMFDARIEPAASSLEASDFPLRGAKADFTARAVVSPVGEPDDMGSRSLDWRVVVRSSAQGDKTIAQGTEMNAFDVSVLGYVASPWEQRILVVYGITHPGFEGERPLTYLFSGCLLTKGFTTK